MKRNVRILSRLLAAVILLTAVFLSACGKKDAIRETREILSAADSFTFTYTIEGRESTDRLALYYVLSATKDVWSEESVLGVTYGVSGADGVTVWEAAGDTYVPSRSYTQAEYAELTRGAESTYGRFLSYLTPDAWEWSRKREAFVLKDYDMFASLGMELTDMELAITGRTCTIMGKGVKMDGTARYPVVITMAVTGIDETTITLPTDITDN